MKLTKFGHSCVLVEVNVGDSARVALFDPGVWSTLPVDELTQLDDIFISHIHADHVAVELVKALIKKFPAVRITAPTEVVTTLQGEAINQAGEVPPEDVQLFDAPHEGHAPFLEPPQEIGIHFAGVYSHPGDSHSFSETKAVLGLPVQAPWGSTIDAVDLALKLKPRYVLPIHDWHWRDEARDWAYNRLEQLFGEYGITFLKPVNGEVIELDV